MAAERGGYQLRGLRAADDAEVEAVVALNNDAVPAVNAVTVDWLHELVRLAAHADVVVGARSDELAGVVLVLPATAAYDSVLFGWFVERYESFLYLGRIVVHPAHRRRGVGRLVYDTMEQRARAAGRLVCEVNVEPPNVDSQAFHLDRGFVEVGRCTLPDKVCQMLAKELRLSAVRLSVASVQVVSGVGRNIPD